MGLPEPVAPAGVDVGNPATLASDSEWVDSDAPPRIALSPGGRALRMLVGVGWVATASGYVAWTGAGFPGQDGRWAIRLLFFGGIALLLSAVPALRALWQATHVRVSRGLAWLALALRITALLAAFGVLFFALTLGANAPELGLIALGRDPLGAAELHLLAAGKELEVRGPLRSGIAADVRALLDRSPGVRVLHLNSPGGWIREGRALADLIRSRALTTYTATGCSSSCVSAFVAGSRRVIFTEARLGLHSSSGSRMDPVYVGAANDGLRGELQALGASEAFVARAIGTPPESLWFPTHDELLANHLIDEVSDGAGFAASGEVLTTE